MSSSFAEKVSFCVILDLLFMADVAVHIALSQMVCASCSSFGINRLEYLDDALEVPRDGSFAICCGGTFLGKGS